MPDNAVLLAVSAKRNVAAIVDLDGPAAARARIGVKP